MKFWQRFFSLFSCLVLLFAVFSIPAAAADDVSIRKVNVFLTSVVAGVSHGQTDVLEGDVGTVSGTFYGDLNANIDIRNRMILANNDSSILLPSGYEYTILLENITFDTTIHEDNGDTHVLSFGFHPESRIAVDLTYADGSMETGVINPEIIPNAPKGNHSVKIIVPDNNRDILKVTIREWQYASSASTSSSHGELQNVSGFEYPLKLSITQEDKSVGLLEGLLAWVKSIGEKVSDSFDVINSGFANIGTWFAELPSKIWDVMENGIKGLFVPDDEYMTEYSDKWDSLLSDRLGAVYQVCDITVNSWGDIMAADQTDTIVFPSVTIPLPEGASFTFGGYDVQIVPDGFSALATAVKSAVGILCTYLFVNGLLKRYEEVMGVRE